jgi:hypothetical protein
MRFSIYRVIFVMMLASMLIVGKSRRVDAQEKAPDLRMLLNLDLFGAQPSGAAADAPSGDGNSATGPSMLDQIRGLNAMGYLGGAPGSQSPTLLAPSGNGGIKQSPPDEGEVPQL